MYVHLNKKITVPNCSKVRTIAWSSDHDFIACGGEDGILKVIKLEQHLSGNSLANTAINNVGKKPTSTKETNGSKNYSHNQNLESHKSTVQSVCWNEPFQKLTSSDESGSIIVWMLYKGNWYEEMVNNRNKSLVTGMAWTHDGQKICIVYDDGAIITGSVDGNRIWGKEMKNANLCQVEWSPDSKTILIGTNELEIQVFDSMGNFVKKIALSTMQTYYNRSNGSKEMPNLVCIKWFKNNRSIEYPLLLAFDDGSIQLMRNDSDDFPKIINAEIRISSVDWNYSGTMFAVVGNSKLSEETGNGKNFLKLYDSNGDLLQIVKVPGNEIYDCSWDRTGLRLALTVDSYIFFANVKQNYEWGSMINSIVFAFPTNVMAGDYNVVGRRLIFWERKTNSQYTIEVNGFCQLTTWTHCCGVVSRITEQISSNFGSESINGKSRPNDLHSLVLYNSIGTLIDRHLVNLKVKHCSLNSNRMVVASNDSFYVWQFKQQSIAANIHASTVKSVYNELQMNKNSDDLLATQSSIFVSRTDPICCIATSEKFLILAHKMGAINQYLLPNSIRVHQFQLDGGSVPSCLALNRNSSKLAVIDRSNKLHIYDFDANNEQTKKEGDWLGIQMQDIWDMRWASDHNDMLALCEKNRLIVVNGVKLEREDAVPSDGYISSFDKLLIEIIHLDVLIIDSIETNPKTQLESYIELIESQTIRELKEIMQQSLTDAFNFALQCPNMACLWTIISEESLRRVQLDTANLAMIKQKNYAGIQLIKKLKKLNDDELKRGEIAAYLHQYDEAEKVYIDTNRPELAVNMRKVIGDYQHVLELLDKFHISNYEKESELVRFQLAQQYVDHCQWSKAVEYFEKVDANEQLVSCYIHMENYEGLIRLIDRISDKTLLLDIGIFLQSMGLCRDSVRAMVKANHVEKAIDFCVLMSEWKMAIDLAHEHHIEHIDSILSQYVQHLLNERKYIEIIEVYRKANKNGKSASVVMTLISELKKAQRGDAVLMKKLFTLIGLLHYESRSKETANSQQSKTALDDLLSSDDAIGSNNSNKKMIEDPWKGAEAYHFLLLTQRHLYDGYYDLAMKTALHLQDYEEFISSEDIYSLIAMASYNRKCFSVCSKAFIKLEASSLESYFSHDSNWNNVAFLVDSDETESSNSKEREISRDKQERYERMAVEIFATNPPNDKVSNREGVIMVDCKFCGLKIPDYSTSCEKCNTKFLPCIASGQSIMEPKNQWSCNLCGHQAIKTEIKQYNNCPLCHYKIFINT